MTDSTALVFLLLATLGAATDGQWERVILTTAYKEGVYNICLFTCPFTYVALNVTITEETCSSVNISWTAQGNKTTHFRILYWSNVHAGFRNYSPDASPPYTTTLTNLVADTEYNITVIAKYSGYTTSMVVIANTKSGMPSEKGTNILCKLDD